MRSGGNRVLELVLAVSLAIACGAGVYWLAQRVGLLGQRSPLGELPLMEVPAEPGAPDTEMLAVLLSADVGWGGLDRGVARQLAARGVGVVGWNRLRAYRAPHTPAEAAGDLVRILDHYSRSWQRDRVLLVGLSLGADVLPLVVEQLPAEHREKLMGIVLVGFGASTDLFSRPGDWLGRTMSGRPGASVEEAQRLQRLPVLCIEGVVERGGACRSIGTSNVSVLDLPADHAERSRSRLITGLILRWVSDLETQAPPLRAPAARRIDTRQGEP